MAVDDNGNIVTDGSGEIVKVSEDGKLMTDASGTYQTYGYKLKEFTDTSDRVAGPYTIENRVDQNIKFTNSLQTTGLKINEEVYSRQSDGESWAKVESVPSAVYNFSLRLFKKTVTVRPKSTVRRIFQLRAIICRKS